MDSRIEKLKSTTFCGTRLTRRRIADIQKTVELFPALSRHELAATLCSHLGWFTPKGRDRLGSCLRMLEQLEASGIVSLGALDDTASLAVPFTEQDGGARTAAGNGFDVHGRWVSLNHGNIFYTWINEN